MKYVLINPCRFGNKHFDVPLSNVIKVHHGTFGCFDNFNDILAVKYLTHNSWGDETEDLKILGHFEYGKNVYGNLGFDKLLGRDPKHIQLYNFNSKYTKEDVMKLLEYGATLK